MSDIYQYLSENSNYQNFLSSNKAEEDSSKEEKSMSLMGLAEASPMLAHMAYTVKNVVSKGSEIYAKASGLAAKTQ